MCPECGGPPDERTAAGMKCGACTYIPYARSVAVKVFRSVDELADELVYRSYRYNREQNPDIPAERWAELFTRQPQMELRYQNERTLERVNGNPYTQLAEGE